LDKLRLHKTYSSVKGKYMKSLGWFSALILMFCQSLIAMADHNAQVKMETIDIDKLATGRPSKINVWFPQGNCTNPTGKQLCLAESAITNKVIIFSHGAMGSAIEYSWIGESLAEKGYVVVGVNHHGESWVYGQDKINPIASGLIWQRAQDISALLDYFTEKNIFQKNINWSNIILIGHSAGGQTAAMLAGATFELAHITDYCKSEKSSDDRSCNYAKNSEKAPESYRALFRAQQQDTRVKMIVMLDPALGSGATTESLKKIKIPAFIIGANNNDFLPWNNHGLRYATGIPNRQVKLLNGQEGHFVFLNPCQNNIKVMDIPLCKDRAGVNRNAIHQQLSQDIFEFIQSNNAAFTERSVPVVASRKQYQPSINLLDIITHTPRWVFGLLAMLIVLGLMQTRTRQVRIQVALILPFIVLILSLTSVIRYVGWQIPALLCWLIGISAVIFFSIKMFNENLVRLDKSSRKLIIQGSWIPMFVILGIFLTRYALGVATAMQFEITRNPSFLLIVSLILGGWSGFFLARGFMFWRAKNAITD